MCRYDGERRRKTCARMLLNTDFAVAMAFRPALIRPGLDQNGRALALHALVSRIGTRTFVARPRESRDALVLSLNTRR